MNLFAETQLPNRCTASVHRHQRHFLVADEESIRLNVLRLRKAGFTLRQIGEKWGVSHGTIARIIKGDFPKNPDIRRKLGLHATLKESECWCGRVHAAGKRNFEQRMLDAREYGILQIYLVLKHLNSRRSS